MPLLSPTCMLVCRLADQTLDKCHMLATRDEKMDFSANSLLTLVLGAGTQSVHVVQAWQAEKPTARLV